MVQWLGLCASNAGDSGSIPGRGIKIPHTKQSDPKKKKDLTECRRMLVCANNLSLQNRQKKKEEVRMEAVLEIEGRELEGLSLPCEARNWIIRG